MICASVVVLAVMTAFLGAYTKSFIYYIAAQSIGNRTQMALWKGHFRKFLSSFRGNKKKKKNIEIYGDTITVEMYFKAKISIPVTLHTESIISVIFSRPCLIFNIQKQIFRRRDKTLILLLNRYVNCKFILFYVKSMNYFICNSRKRYTTMFAIKGNRFFSLNIIK